MNGTVVKYKMKIRGKERKAEIFYVVVVICGAQLDT